MVAFSRRVHLIVGAAIAVFLLITLSFGVHKTSDIDISKSGIKIGWKKKTPPGLRDENLAYVIFLSGTLDQKDDLEEDKYFVAVRILIWQLLHKEDTRAEGIDVVVMVTPSVSESRRKRMEEDGAILYPVELLHTENDSWIHAGSDRWTDVMTKLRVLEMTEYDRILMLDGDTLLHKQLDYVFDEPAAQVQKNDRPRHYKYMEGEAPLPHYYLMAGKSEVHCWGVEHDFPPKKKQINVPSHFNAGFMMFAPSRDLFHYYTSFLDIEDSFDSKYPEQNLLNYAHRWNGPMPWKVFDPKWNTLCPNKKDFKAGVVSFHEKWWGRNKGYGTLEDDTKEWLMQQRIDMKEWYEARDRNSTA